MGALPVVPQPVLCLLCHGRSLFHTCAVIPGETEPPGVTRALGHPFDPHAWAEGQHSSAQGALWNGSGAAARWAKVSKEETVLRSRNVSVVHFQLLYNLSCAVFAFGDTQKTGRNFSPSLPCSPWCSSNREERGSFCHALTCCTVSDFVLLTAHQVPC